MSVKPADISSKYSAMLTAAEKLGGDNADAVKNVFAQAGANKTVAKELKSLLHMGKLSGTSDVDRFNARLTLVLDLAKRMDKGTPLKEAITTLKQVDKRTLAQKCHDGAKTSLPKGMLQGETELLSGLSLMPTAPKTPPKPSGHKPSEPDSGRVDLSRHELAAQGTGGKYNAQSVAIAAAHRERTFTHFSTPQALVKHFKGELDVYKKFACTDAETFPGNIKKELSEHAKEEILGRTKTKDYAKPSRKQAEDHANSTALPSNGKLKQTDLAIVHDALNFANAGCCSTFAAAAADILSQGKRPAEEGDVRVEVVARQNKFNGTHCYVLVGRALGSKLDDPTTWGKDCMIVDPWLGSLGHDTAFTVDSYPYKGYLKANRALYDNTVVEVAVSDDQAREGATSRLNKGVRTRVAQKPAETQQVDFRSVLKPRTPPRPEQQ
ncbi:MAG: hypothetical protein IT381_10830 [Deltaproteobacteria bacterium]|nr:hypothetical protein [Deltaproteobacteria bacterium]